MCVCVCQINLDRSGSPCKHAIKARKKKTPPCLISWQGALCSAARKINTYFLMQLCGSRGHKRRVRSMQIHLCRTGTAEIRPSKAQNSCFGCFFFFCCRRVGPTKVEALIFNQQNHKIASQMTHIQSHTKQVFVLPTCCASQRAACASVLRFRGKRPSAGQSQLHIL